MGAYYHVGHMLMGTAPLYYAVTQIVLSDSRDD